MNSFLFFINGFLPKALITRFFGWFSTLHISSKYIHSFCKKYEVNLEEAIIPDDGFYSFNEFYTRKLKPGYHTISKGKNDVVAPVDAKITQCGPITGTRIMQAKDLDFLVSDLVPAEVHHMFIDGFFTTFYIPLSNYHRVHSPLDGTVSTLIHKPGRVFPLHEIATEKIRRIFTKNERLISIIDTPSGKCALCMIGAMNFAKMSVNFEPIITHKVRRKLFVKSYTTDKPQVHRGDEFGRFMSGSTVILLFEKEMFNPDSLRAGNHVKMGQKIGELITKPI
jgi:phosphatidylserine decarboxylase